MRGARWLLVLALVARAYRMPAVAAEGEINAEQPAALLIYPYVAVDTAAGGDTLLQLSNSDTAPVDVRCFYDNADPFERLLDFRVRLTPGQPIAWRASQGLADLPLSIEPGPGGDKNTGLIPAVASSPFVGSLRCLAVQPMGSPADRNVLTGDATIEHYRTTPAPLLDAATYRAIGIQAIPGRNNGDDVLVLGGPDAEYGACPPALVLQHFADGAIVPATTFADGSEVFTTLVVIPCARDLDQRTVSGNTVQLLQYNEFAQRLGMAQPLGIQLVSTLSRLTGAQPERSIFHVTVQGTLTGQTVIRSADDSGILAVALETHRNLASGRTTTTAFTVNYEGRRAAGDTLVLPSVAPATPTPTVSPTATPTNTPLPTHTLSPTSTKSPSPTVTVALSRTPTVPAGGGGGGCSIVAPRAAGASTGFVWFLGTMALLWRRHRQR